MWYLFSKQSLKLLLNWRGYTVLPGFRALGPITALSALNPGSALLPRLDLVHFELHIPQKAQVTLNKNAHNLQHHLGAQYFMHFHIV